MDTLCPEENELFCECAWTPTDCKALGAKTCEMLEAEAWDLFNGLNSNGDDYINFGDLD
jgi:hypothetical protein